MQFAFTIIIPHKNIPDLLQRCLDSIPQRDDIQIVIVDDNSDPDIVDFEHFPGLNRTNVEVYFDKSSKGAGRARNVGLEHAKGDWLIFSDSDDIFTDQFGTILDKIVTDKVSDIVYFNVISKDSETLRATTESDFFSAIINDIANQGITDYNKYLLLTPWAKSVRREMVERYGIKFEEVPYSNDTSFSAKSSFYARTVKALQEPGYCWMLREGSLWRQQNLSWYVVRMQVSSRIAKFMKSCDDTVGEQFFTTNARVYLNGITHISKLHYIKWVLWYAWYMHDYKQIYWRFLMPILRRIGCVNEQK